MNKFFHKLFLLLRDQDPISVLPSGHDDTDDRPDQDDRRDPDKYPFKGMKSRSKNRRFRVAEIPTQVWTVQVKQHRRDEHDPNCQYNEKKVSGLSSGLLPLGKLQIDDFQLL